MLQDYRRLKKVSTFCLKLKTLIDSGIPLATGLQSLAHDESDPHFKALIERLSDHLYAGEELTAGIGLLLPHGVPFDLSRSRFSGNVSVLLTQLSEYYAQKVLEVSTLFKKLLYPFFLLAAMCGLLGFIGGFLIPSYSTFYSNMGIALPFGLTLILNVTQGIGLWVCLGVLILAVAFGFQPLKRKLYGWFFSQTLTDFVWMMSVFLQSGLPLKQALACFEFSPNSPLHRDFQKFHSHFLSEGLFSTAFNTHFTLSSYQQELILHAEKSGELAHFLLLVAHELKEQELVRIQTVLNLVQPILLLLMGLLIFGCVYMMFLPILSTLKHVL